MSEDPFTYGEGQLWIAPVDSPGDALVAEPMWRYAGRVEDVQVTLRSGDSFRIETEMGVDDEEDEP